jgi:hypothetical protein
MKDAGLKTLSTAGISEEWMVAGGISAALPFKFNPCLYRMLPFFQVLSARMSLSVIVEDFQ